MVPVISVELGYVLINENKTIDDPKVRVELLPDASQVLAESRKSVMNVTNSYSTSLPAQATNETTWPGGQPLTNTSHVAIRNPKPRRGSEQPDGFGCSCFPGASFAG